MKHQSRFYRTYEGLKLHFCVQFHFVFFSFYRTYEGLKQARESVKIALLRRFYRTYEGLKRPVLMRCPSGIFVFIVPMRD
ncbi:hypothetical protein B4113_1664 [Geobacillus sp. B4113_201601]|nr:hypothetical protein B4113_1664 [Geobacillus sp. B4113_201601]